MNEPSGAPPSFTPELRRRVARWTLIWVTLLSLLFFASAFTAAGVFIGLILAVPGFPLLVLIHWRFPYEGIELLLVLMMAPWLVPGVPVALWVGLVSTRNRLFPTIGVAMLVFAIWSTIIQLIFVLQMR